MSDILTFDGDNAYLSNFYPASFVWNGIVWHHSEGAYQAAKTLDRSERLKIADVRSPAVAKRMGKALVCRTDWASVKREVMYQVVYAKFTQNPELRAKLINTGHVELQEGNTWGDRIWGVCPPGSGNGSNWLGQVLMDIRNEFRIDDMFEW